jgi:hypothetical protein
MTTPSSDIGISDIWTEAGNPSPSGGDNISFGDLSRISYFEGSNGSSTYSFNGWGRYGNTTGANRIFGLTAQDTPQAINDFGNKDYFYDGSTYQAKLNFNNQLSFPVFPTPPSANDFNITVELYDSTQTYQYAFGSAGAPAQASGGINFEQASVTPLIGVLYYVITIDSDPNGGGGTTNVNINGTNVFNGASPLLGSQLIVDFGTYGSVNTNGSGCDINITFT